MNLNMHGLVNFTLRLLITRLKSLKRLEAVKILLIFLNNHFLIF